MTTSAQKTVTPAQTDNLPNFILQQRKEGRADETIRSRIQTLKQITKACNLDDPEAIKEYLANSKWSNKTKTKAIDTCSAYLRFRQITWNPPHYTNVERLPFIPTEQEIDLLIAASGRMLGTVLQMLKETGMRIGELTLLKPLDIDTERKTVNITPEKGSNPRILPISDKLIGMIKTLPNDPRKTYKTLFQPHKDTLRDYLCKQRKELAQKLNNPRIQKIGFHTLRHWKGTMEYHNTGDLRHVQKILGHKQITSTVIYENTASALWLTETDQYTCKVAHDEKEEIQLIEAGFTHINNREGLAFYKKRK